MKLSWSCGDVSLCPTHPYAVPFPWLTTEKQASERSITTKIKATGNTERAIFIVKCADVELKPSPLHFQIKKKLNRFLQGARITAPKVPSFLSLEGRARFCEDGEAFALLFTSRKWGRLPDPGYSQEAWSMLPLLQDRLSRERQMEAARSLSKPVSRVLSSPLISASSQGRSKPPVNCAASWF